MLPQLAPSPSCGDGQTDPGEDCDLGRLNEPEPYGAGRCSTVCKLAASCGDGTRNGPEECDDGPRNLESAGPYGLEGQCNVLCRRVSQFCGDGELTAPETCDRGPENSSEAYGTGQCTQSCAPAPFCGDGLPSLREECDLGPANTLDSKIWSLGGGGCNQVCRSIVKRCGDGLTDAPDEDCDAGSMNTTSDSTYGAGAACNRRCKRVAFCGDGTKDAREHCDLGARNTGDDKLWGFTAGGCNRICFIITRFCGDGFVEGAPDEQCDLGPGRNTGAPGGCDARCRIVPP